MLLSKSSKSYMTYVNLSHFDSLRFLCILSHVKYNCNHYNQTLYNLLYVSVY